MPRLIALFLLALFPIALNAQTTASAPAARPNIVVLLADDLRWDYVGYAGHPFIETPQIDRLAREGCIFENALVSTPLCSPSRATLLTGLNAAQHLVGRNGGEFPRRMTNLGERMRTAGYTTAFLGKTGFEDAPAGFDHLVDFLSPKDGGRGDTYNDAVFQAGDETIRTNGFSTDALTALAVEHLRASRQPFFMVLSVKNPHVPYTPPARHARHFNDAEISLPDSYGDPIGDLPAVIRHNRNDQAPLFTARPLFKQYRAFERVPSKEQPGPRLIRKYSKMVPSIDDALGELRKTLEAEDLWDNTVVIFTSDNGILLGEKGIFGKELLYEDSIRVPLVIRDPAAPAGRRVRAATVNTDLAPTILAYAGKPAPAEMTGHSLRDLVRGTADDNPRDACLLIGGYAPHLRQPEMLGLRTDRYKYIRYVRGEREEELFDLQADPHERNDLSDNAAAATTLQDLRRQFDEQARRQHVPKEWLDTFPF